ncbi:MAG: flagellar basal body rod protein FlgB [Pseudomonadales bacterium]|nr:flagellar basal body rod protein FlgB [Pseudomonadales bacterium]
MAISFESALGIHEQALVLRNKRTEVLANNIANADTPGFKARDIDFQKVLSAQTEFSDLPRMQTSHASHMAFGDHSSSATKVTLSYRVPAQASMDGNTVDAQQENAAFARNALEHQASFQFLNGKFTGLIKALRGE